MLLRLGSWKNILFFLDMFFSKRKLGRVGWRMELMLRGHKVETSCFSPHNKRGWAEDGWVKYISLPKLRWWSMGEPQQSLFIHWKAICLWLLRIVQTVFLTGWTYSPRRARAAPIERVTVGCVDTLTLQGTVRSVLAWPAFSITSGSGSPRGAQALSSHWVAEACFFTVTKLTAIVSKHSRWTLYPGKRNPEKLTPWVSLMHQNWD